MELTEATIKQLRQEAEELVNQMGWWSSEANGFLAEGNDMIKCYIAGRSKTLREIIPRTDSTQQIELLKSELESKDKVLAEARERSDSRYKEVCVLADKLLTVKAAMIAIKPYLDDLQQENFTEEGVGIFENAEQTKAYDLFSEALKNI